MQGTLSDNEEDTQIYVCDINPNMLNVGKKRAAERGLNSFILVYSSISSCEVLLFNSWFYSGYSDEHYLRWIQGDAEALSFEDGSMDGYTIAFGIRNVTHIEKALAEAYRLAGFEFL
jgi:2-methoxy-6-polyprenyl-1,4-benzoquinol methylase